MILSVFSIIFVFSLRDFLARCDAEIGFVRAVKCRIIAEAAGGTDLRRPLAETQSPLGEQKPFVHDVAHRRDAERRLEQPMEKMQRIRNPENVLERCRRSA